MSNVDLSEVFDYIENILKPQKIMFSLRNNKVDIFRGSTTYIIDVLTIQDFLNKYKNIIVTNKKCKDIMMAIFLGNSNLTISARDLY